ncbi:MAG: hypothetical protein WC873_03460 [Candidatus Gracilibacteria bacterium]
MREVNENHSRTNQAEKQQGPSLIKTVLALVMAIRAMTVGTLAFADDNKPEDSTSLEAWMQQESFQHAKARAITAEEVYLKFGRDPFAIPEKVESLAANKIKLLAKLQAALMRNSHNRLHSSKDGGLYSPGISYDSLIFEIHDGNNLYKLVVDKDFSDIKIVGDPNREVSNLVFIKLIEHLLAIHFIMNLSLTKKTPL